MSDADEDFDGGAAAEVEEEEEERFDEEEGEEEEEEEDRFRTRTAPALPPRTPFAGLTPFAPSSFAPQTVPPPPPTAAAAASVGLVPQTPTTPMTPGPVHHILQNIVSTVNLGCRLDLKKIALGARNAEYNPRRFAAVIMRIREPKTTALIFGSGKMVCTGAKSVDDAKLASKKYARIVQKLGFPAKFLEFKVQNMVASADVRFPIRLEGIAFAQPRFSSYEPELFPGLIYRMIQPKVVLLIFVSGKVVLTGAKDEAQIAQAFSNILPVLYGHKKAV